MPYAGHYHTDGAFLRACERVVGLPVTLTIQDISPRQGRPAVSRWHDPNRRLRGPHQTVTGVMIEVNHAAKCIIIGNTKGRYRIPVAVICNVSYTGHTDMLLHQIVGEIPGGSMAGIHAGHFNSDQSFAKAIRPMLGKRVEVATGAGRPFDRWDRSARHQEPLNKMRGILEDVTQGHRRVILIVNGKRFPIAIVTISYIREIGPAPESAPENPPPSERGWRGRDGK